MTATATGSLFEVQGLVLCPRHGDRHPRKTRCTVPDEGEWHGIFFVGTLREAEGALEHVMESDSPIYERYEDFRIAEPTPKRLRRRLEHQGYIWDTSRRRRTPRPADEPVAAIKPRKKRKRAA